LTERQRTVALLIDYDNLQICYTRDAPGTQLDLGAVVAMAQTYGRVVVARAYAEWNLLSERMAVYKAGIEPAFAPVLRPEGSSRDGKSLADTVMVADGVDVLWSYNPDVLMLVTSDKDMIPLARLAKQRGAVVVVLGSDLTAVPLLEMANEFVTYRHLIRELGRLEEKPASSPIREEPRLRRARDATGGREVAAAREASVREPRTLPSRPRARLEAVSTRTPTLGGSTADTGEDVVGATDAAIGEGQGDSAGIEVEAPAVAPRRRRRRGGRTRRVTPVGLGGELDGAAASEAATAATAPSEPVEPTAEVSTEAATLRPWERWPERASQFASSSIPTAPSEPETPSTAEEDAAGTQAALERAALPEEAVNKDVAEEWKPTANGEAKPAAPPRRRRVRGSPPTRPRTKKEEPSADNE
jgi:uncharacterized LabA/DUF88 family protein